MISVAELTAKIKSYHPNLNEALIQKAYVLSKTAHGNQKRHSGDPYFLHPLAVAEILIDLKLDQETIITALLHDVVEDTDVTLEEIAETFGENVARLVDGVTKLGKIESISANERVAENFRKLTLAMSEDIRVLFVKLADRLHNMSTLSYMPSREKREKKARESLDIYAPLAARIGLNKIKDELQEYSFEAIEPESRNHIVQNLNYLKEKEKDIIEDIIKELSSKLEAEGVNFKISGREKKPYSIWLKMKKQNVAFHHLHDIIAFRIVVDDLAQCYRVLGIINSNYNMIPRTFKDYISTPKENGYKSLHLAILGPMNKKIEIQIRDQKMHEVADLGVAAHWHYKEQNNTKYKNNLSAENHQYLWINELVALFENSEFASDALKQHKLEMHKNEVFCFTPNGDIFNLPIGATVVDFAYAIHSQVGNNCVSAKVNGVITPLRQKLENGDQVEILTSKNSKPSPNWLQFVTTSKAKYAIKSFIKAEKFSEYSALGKAILNKFFASKNLEINEKMLEKILPNFGRKTVADLYVKIADGSLPRADVLKFLYPDFKEESKQLSQTKTQEKKKKSSHAIPIDGLVSGMAIHYAGCCIPIPGDLIVGVINTGAGVTIHAQNCHNLKNIALNPQRILDVCWKSDDEIGDELYSSRVKIIVHNQSGSLADVSSIIASKKINITGIKTTNRSADHIEFIIDIEVKNLEHLEEIISSLRISKKILEVQRVV
ncbi:MAG: bifunctional (p)ppGpp synthetase/guanosine-3',5'-bis(diphosphate) 3'-pyrophosphohydrolase [Pelagibacterales bacterium]|nr:bifunctional (p)ppGpp synthetase/guanosine-3',5'-bis(diphosphate) 3'-pyrophosphohydrolase [Pelagibacterales bacterium]